MDTTEECFRKAFLKELAFKLAWENMNRLHLWVDGVKGIARRESGGVQYVQRHRGMVQPFVEGE